MFKLRVGVFGDSFADRAMNPIYMYEGRKDESWIQVLEDSGCNIESYGMGGTSTWFSYEKFLQMHKYFNAIIFVVSHFGRISCMPEEFARYSTCHDPSTLYKSSTFLSLDHEKQNQVLDLVKAANMMKNHTFDKFVVKHIYDDVNNICREKNIKLITLLPFETRNSIEKYNTRNLHGDCLFNLIPTVYKELDVTHSDSRYCHLSEENNKILGNLMFESLNSNKPPRLIDLSNDVNFVFHPSITERYEKMRTK